jgi:hypothetical protein
VSRGLPVARARPGLSGWMRSQWRAVGGRSAFRTAELYAAERPETTVDGHDCTGDESCARAAEPDQSANEF